MDPFRDELAAAHAKIAELEEQVRQLHATRPPQRMGKSAKLVLILLALVAFFIFTNGVLMAFAFFRGAHW